MNPREHVTNIMGFLVVAHEEGQQLGNIYRIYIDPEVGRIASLSFRAGPMSKPEFVNAEFIERIGEDVVLITGKKAISKITEKTKPAGRDLKDLLGAWVTTMNGEHLGTLIDLDVNPDTWEITDLWLGDGGHLQIDAADLRIGKDELLVPVEYAKKVKREAANTRRGVFTRMLGSTTIDDLAASIRRALRPSEEAEKASKKTTKSAKKTTRKSSKRTAVN